MIAARWQLLNAFSLMTGVRDAAVLMPTVNRAQLDQDAGLKRRLTTRKASVLIDEIKLSSSAHAMQRHLVQLSYGSFGSISSNRHLLFPILTG